MPWTTSYCRDRRRDGLSCRWWTGTCHCWWERGRCRTWMRRNELRWTSEKDSPNKRHLFIRDTWLCPIIITLKKGAPYINTLEHNWPQVEQAKFTQDKGHFRHPPKTPLLKKEAYCTRREPTGWWRSGILDCSLNFTLVRINGIQTFSCLPFPLLSSSRYTSLSLMVLTAPVVNHPFDCVPLQKPLLSIGAAHLLAGWSSIFISSSNTFAALEAPQPILPHCLLYTPISSKAYA